MTLQQHILVASNRGPVSFTEKEGELIPKRGAGGLVTALTGVLQGSEGMWVASAMTGADRVRAAQSPEGRMDVVVEDAKYRLRLLSFDPHVYDPAYNTVSNRLLWFLHHYLWDVPRWPRFGAQARVSWEAYRTVNRTFAEALAQESAGRRSTALIQDYHLSLAPDLLRALAPDLQIAYFHHCPFAGPGYMRLVPRWLRDEMLSGLLGADLLGFQTRRWAEDFLFTARMLPDTKVDLEARTVEWRGRTVRVGVYPITIDSAQMREDAQAPEVAEKRRELEEWRGDRRMLLRVDRAELSKNILRGFLAFEDLLRRFPEWRGRVVFLAHLNPSRGALEEYRRYVDECIQVAERINEELGESGWVPIKVDLGDDFAKVLAAYTLYDVLMVNPIFDGMNLVVKEGALLNRRNGVVILSRNAGAIQELEDHVVPVDPLDIVGTAEAVRTALEMPEERRRNRAAALTRIVAGRSPEDWINEQLADLARIRGD